MPYSLEKAPYTKCGVFRDKSKKNSSPQIAVRFDLETMNYLRDLAKRTNRSVAGVIRKFVAQSL